MSPSLPPVPRPRAPAAGSPLRRAEPPVCHTRGALGLKTCSARERSRLLPEMEAKAGEEADALPEASPQEQACSVTCGEGAVRYRLSLSRSSAVCGSAALNTCDHSCPKFLIVPNNNCPREAPTPRARPPALAHVTLVSVFMGLPPGIFKMEQLIPEAKVTCVPGPAAPGGLLTGLPLPGVAAPGRSVIARSARFCDRPVPPEPALPLGSV